MRHRKKKVERLERTFPWWFSFDSLLDERAWEPGGVQTLVPTSGPQQS